MKIKKYLLFTITVIFCSKLAGVLGNNGGNGTFATGEIIMDTLLDAPVKFTDGAIREIIRLGNEGSSPEDKWLRVGVKGGGCSGMTYVLNFDERVPGDIVYEMEGFSFIMDPSHEMYLFGMEVHFEGGLNSRGFTFTNPNASKTCGCGTSFSV